MTSNLRISAVFALLVLLAVSSFGQSSQQSGTYSTGTVVDVDNGRGRLQIETEDHSRITVETDAVSTTYHGFGTMIAGKPEIFTGSKGFSNVRLGDRLRITGYSSAEGVMFASRITLSGREVAANPVGVGQTREQTRVTTPTDDRTTTATRTPANTVEGTIRQINVNEGRIVIQTPQRRMMTVRTSRNTPVIYRGETYRIENLEEGDEIRVEADARSAQADEIIARRIEVTESVQESTDYNQGGVITLLEGRVVRTEPGLDYAYLNDGRSEVRVDMSQAEDADGNRIRARDLRVNDTVEISGNYNRAGDLFMASTVRYTEGTRRDRPGDFIRYGVVTLTGTVVETLEDAPTVGLRDSESQRTVRLWVTEDFIVRTKGGTNTSAGALRVNDSVLVKAYRDLDGNLIAQTIRLRNR